MWVGLFQRTKKHPRSGSDPSLVSLLVKSSAAVPVVKGSARILLVHCGKPFGGVGIVLTFVVFPTSEYSRQQRQFLTSKTADSKGTRSSLWAPDHSLEHSESCCAVQKRESSLDGKRER